MSRRIATTAAAGRFRRLGERIARRRGATIIEMALVLPVFLSLTIGMLDLGIAVFRQHALGHAARQAARLAVVHGEMADRLGIWGPPEQPSLVQGTADTDFHEIAPTIRPLLSEFDLSSVNVAMEWVDGNNDLGSKLQVRLTTEHHFLFAWIIGLGSITLEGSSTMQIAH
jgi:hypothetical protein